MRRNAFGQRLDEQDHVSNFDLTFFCSRTRAATRGSVSGNIMVSRNADRIAFIDWGQTDAFLIANDDKREWFSNFKKLMLKMHAAYDPQQQLFAHNTQLFLDNLKHELAAHGSGGLQQLFAKAVLDPIDAESALRRAFLSDLAAVMVQLGFESERNSQQLLAGTAMGAFNNDPRFTGAHRALRNVELDPLRVFPRNAALLFRAITAISGMLDEQQQHGNSLTERKTLVELFVPFLKSE